MPGAPGDGSMCTRVAPCGAHALSTNNSTITSAADKNAVPAMALKATGQEGLTTVSSPVEQEGRPASGKEGERPKFGEYVGEFRTCQERPDRGVQDQIRGNDNGRDVIHRRDDSFVNSNE